MKPNETITARDNCVITFREIFAYRSVWMLLAILWIVLFHSPLTLPGPLNMVKLTGYGGVEIFLLASGIGCFFSLGKNPSITQFLKRRLSSILPTWILFLAIYCAFQLRVSTMTVNEILGNLFGWGTFAGLKHQFNWYIGAMWVCYLTAPVLTDVVQNTTMKQKICITVLLAAMSTAFFGQYILMFYSRIPIYFLSFVIAELSTRKPGLTGKEVLLTLGAMVLGVGILGIATFRYPDAVNHYGMCWYPFLLITPGLVLLISLIAKALSATRLSGLVQCMNKLGQYTFPLYLSHLFVFDDLFGKLYAYEILQETTGTHLLSVLISFLFAIFLHYLTRFVTFLWQKGWRRA